MSNFIPAYAVEEAKKNARKKAVLTFLIALTLIALVYWWRFGR